MNYTGERAVLLARYIISTGCTVRAAAAAFGVSKSTVFSDVSKRLLRIDRRLWLLANSVLQKNKSERHIRGGMATRRKHREIRVRALAPVCDKVP